MPERLRTARHRIVGARQTLRAVESGRAEIVYLARDADEKLTQPIRAACQRHGVEVVWVDSMKLLGQYGGIEVGAAAAAVAREGGVIGRRRVSADHPAAGE